MAELVVISFPSEAKAEELRQKLLAMQKDYLIELGDAVIAVKDAKGGIKLNQLLNTTAAAAVSGTFWGSLIGLIFLMPLVGAAIGAASGAITGALTDLGINDRWMKEVAAAIQPGRAVPTDTQGNRRQSPRGLARRGRHRNAHLAGPHKRRGVAGCPGWCSSDGPHLRFLNTVSVSRAADRSYQNKVSHTKKSGLAR
jgi:hypothetical protein